MKEKIKDLPDQDHVMRYVPWTKLRRDEDENVVGFLPEAFQLRLDAETCSIEEYLSVNWIEYQNGAWVNRIRASVRAIRGARRSVGGKSAYAIGNVGKIKEVCVSNGIKVRVVHEPENNNPAHSAIRRLPRDDLSLLAALADDVFTDIVRNADVPPEEPNN